MGQSRTLLSFVTTYTCSPNPRTFVQTLTAVFPSHISQKYVCITTIEYKHHPRRTTDHDDWPRRPRRTIDHEERLTTKNDWPRRTTNHEEDWQQRPRRTTDHNDWPRYDSAPFRLTRTRPCATFDIRGHVLVENFHCFAHCERTMRCVHCKTTCVYIIFQLTKTCICVTINITLCFHLPSHRYSWILIPPRDVFYSQILFNIPLLTYETMSEYIGSTGAKEC